VRESERNIYEKQREGEKEKEKEGMLELIKNQLNNLFFFSILIFLSLSL
jgi:hypothetical protein